jgi:hypothetical protein
MVVSYGFLYADERAYAVDYNDAGKGDGIDARWMAYVVG